jgi:hypothetical protein
MIATVAQTDAWTATMTRRLETIRSAMLDVIDLGIDENSLPTSRDPSRKEQDATDRRDGRFVPTPSGAAGATRQAGVSRPTENRVLAQEGAVQALTSHLFYLCSEVDRSIVGGFGLEVDEMEPPSLRNEEATYLRPSKIVVDLDVRACRRWIDQATYWLENVAKELAALWLASEGEHGDRVGGHATWFGTAVRAVEGRVSPTKVREWCQEGCGRPAEVKDGYSRARCRSCRRQGQLAS